MTAVTQVYDVKWWWLERDLTNKELRYPNSRKKSTRNRKPNRVVVFETCQINATDFDDATEKVETMLDGFIKDFLKASPMVERHPNSYNAFVEVENPKRIWGPVQEPDGFSNKGKTPVRTLAFQEKDKMAIHIRLSEDQS